MSKNVSVKEGDRARNFGPTAKIKTELQAGGSCYWVPEDERETGHIFASENREYTPDEINKYGIDSIDVNIIFTGTTIDGDPWSVTIDPDTGLPIIDIDDVEITIDDVTGDIDISTPDIDITIDDADLDDFGIDPEADVDISIDDLGDIEISDGDISIDFDPETGEWDTGECPASIKIMHVPDKTSYRDGERIDLDGIVVQAFGADGSPWQSSKYPEGYIPAHELYMSQEYADYNSGHSGYETPDYSDNVTEISSIGSIEQIVEENILTSEEATELADDSISGFLDNLGQYDGTNVCIAYNWTMPKINPDGYAEAAGVTATYDVAFVFDPITNPVNPSQDYPGTLYRVWFGWSVSASKPEANYLTAHPSTRRESRRIFSGIDPLTGNVSSANMIEVDGHVNDVQIGWTSPCLETFESKLQVDVSAPGSHHSGKF